MAPAVPAGNGVSRHRRTLGARNPGAAGFRPCAIVFALATALQPTPPAAQPTGGVAIHGSASFANHGNRLTVTTGNGAGTKHSAINWQSFSVPRGTTTEFLQPSATSTSINRVVTNNPSAIFGTLASNGRLVLVNPSGITVGSGAVVDTAGFTASTLAMAEADAKAGLLRFSGAGAPLNVEGGAVVRGQGGDVVLIAPQVQAAGDALVESDGATVLLAGRKVEITGRGLEGIRMEVQAGDKAVNLGTLRGDAVGIFAGTLQHSGLVQAHSARVDGGKVVLKALEDAAVDGAIRARAGRQGGSVDVLGRHVALRAGADIDAGGVAGGGQVRIGGDYLGGNPDVPNAVNTSVDAQAGIRADAGEHGVGGRVIVWADDTTRMHGSISARGGAQGGDGGFAEVSGKKSLVFRGSADLRAPQGNAGTLVLDPRRVDIGNDDKVSSLLVGALNGLLQNGNVHITTEISAVLFDGEITLAAGSEIAWESDNRLTLEANNGIVLNGNIRAADGRLRLSSHFGSVTQQFESVVQVDQLLVRAGGRVEMSGANAVNTIAGSAGNGFSFRNAQALTVGQVFDCGCIENTSGVSGGTSPDVGGAITISTPGVLTLAQRVRSNASGTAVVLAAGDIVHEGGGEIETRNGRWLVYLPQPTANMKEGPNSRNLALWGRPFDPFSPPAVSETGNRYLFATRPAFTVVADDKTKVYDGNSNFGPLTFTASGLVDAKTYGDVFLQDVFAGGTLAVAGAGRNVGSYVITNGTVAAPAGYALDFKAGHATITPAPLTLAGIAANSKVYDGTTTATLAGPAVLQGIVDGDRVDVAFSTVTFNDRNVGTAKPVSLTGAALTGAEAGNYVLTGLAGPVTADITPRALRVDGLAALDKVYDATVAAMLTGTAGVTALAGDKVSLSGMAVGSFADKNVGANKPVSLTGVSLSGPDAGNYALALPTLSASITPAPLALTGLTANDKVYDTTVHATLSGTASVSPLGRDSVTISGTALASFADRNVGAAKPVSLRGLALSGPDAGNYSLALPTLSAAITPATLTLAGVTANDKVYDGTTAATLGGAGTLQGVLGADSVNVLAGTASFADPNAGAGKPVTVSGVALSGPDAGNYRLAPLPTLLAEITPAPLTISAVDLAKEQGAALAFTGAEFTAQGLVGSERIASVTLASAGAPAPAPQGTYAITPTAVTGGNGFRTGNYRIAYREGALAVLAVNTAPTVPTAPTAPSPTPVPAEPTAPAAPTAPAGTAGPITPTVPAAPAAPIVSTPPAAPPAPTAPAGPTAPTAPAAPPTPVPPIAEAPVPVAPAPVPVAPAPVPVAPAPVPVAPAPVPVAPAPVPVAPAPVPVAPAPVSPAPFAPPEQLIDQVVTFASHFDAQAGTQPTVEGAGKNRDIGKDDVVITDKACKP